MSDGRHDSGAVTLVTGGASGIGAATVRRLLAAGHRVAVTGRDQVRLDAFAGQLGAGERVLAIAADTTDLASVGAAVEATLQTFGRLDHVVANAGFSTHDNLADGDPDHWREMLMVNVLGPAVLVKAALPALTENGGRIVMVGSTAGIKNTPGNMYSVTKGALTSLAENIRVLVTSVVGRFGEVSLPSGVRPGGRDPGARWASQPTGVGLDGRGDALRPGGRGRRLDARPALRGRGEPGGGLPRPARSTDPVGPWPRRLGTARRGRTVGTAQPRARHQACAPGIARGRSPCPAGCAPAARACRGRTGVRRDGRLMPCLRDAAGPARREVLLLEDQPAEDVDAPPPVLLGPRHHRPPVRGQPGFPLPVGRETGRGLQRGERGGRNVRGEPVARLGPEGLLIGRGVQVHGCGTPSFPNKCLVG
ncbi:3-phenylpropionate-dihydrodiol/cinnamic acid-dihydrodiol dehydrogenase [Streptomyces xanthochromogenes]